MRELSKAEFNHEIAIANLNDGFVEQDWVIVYSFQTWDDELEEGCSMFRYRRCYLVDPHNDSSYISNPRFDIGENEYCSLINGTKYRKYPKDGIEPLFTRREFKINSGYQHQVRINEEFIHIHGLFEKWIDEYGIEKRYIDFNDGEEIDVVIVTKNEIKIRHTYLMAFMQIKKLNLICGLHEEQGFSTKYRKLVPYSPCISDGNIIIENQDGNLIYNSWYNIAGGIERQNIFDGKKLVRYNPHQDFMKKLDPKYVDYIIGYDNNLGSNILQSCYPDGTSSDNNEVFFKKEVLEKYRMASTVRINTLSIEMVGKWTLKCDNDLDEYIIVRIKDLSYLPFSEQNHWRTYNIVPQNVQHSEAFKMSKDYWGPLQYTSKEYILRGLIIQCNTMWNEYFGWHLFNPLSNYQKESLYQIFKLSINDYSPFAELLTKTSLVITASINVEVINELKQLYEERDMPITKLKKYLKSINIELPKFTEFLTNLNTLRSYFTNAHPHKGSYKDRKFTKKTAFIGFDADKENFIEATNNLFVLGIEAFQEAITFFSAKSHLQAKEN